MPKTDVDVKKTDKKYRILGLKLALYTLPVCIVVGWLTGDDEVAMIAAVCAGLLGFDIYDNWEMHHSFWFWLIVCFLAMTQVAIVVLIPWRNTHFLGSALLPLALVDVYFMYKMIDVTKKCVLKHSKETKSSTSTSQ